MAKGGFKGGPMRGGGGGANMMRQAQKMQEDMLKMQSEMEERTYSAASGGGAVTATVSGKHELLSLEISPDAVDPEDVDMLTDMVVAAVNEALRAADKAMSENMSKLTGGIDLSGFGL